jgi:hypothetical protein
MLNNTLLDTLYRATHTLAQPVLDSVFFFHDVRIKCQTNHPAIVNILSSMLSMFPEPERVRGEVTYIVLCYESAAQFPVPLPHKRTRTETIRLLTNTKLKYYSDSEGTTQYQSYVALPPINEAVLSIIAADQSIALTQLEMPERYQVAFLRRYVMLLALGQLMQAYGFEPCHAGTVTAPYDSQQGALILGTSGSGKTTLSIGCATYGCGLLGDDLVMLRSNEEDGTIGAFAISHEVSIRSGSLSLLPTLAFLYDVPADHRDKRYCAIEQVRTGAARMQTSIRLLLFPSLTTEPRSIVTPLSKASTFQALVNECLSRKTFSGQTQEQLFTLLSTLADQAAGYRLELARGTNDGPDIVRSLFTGGRIL